MLDNNGAELGSFVRQSMDPDGCCHDLLYTRQWLDRNGYDGNAVIAWLDGKGITCDCETINAFNKSDTSQEHPS